MPGLGEASCEPLCGPVSRALQPSSFHLPHGAHQLPGNIASQLSVCCALCLRSSPIWLAPGLPLKPYVMSLEKLGDVLLYSRVKSVPLHYILKAPIAPTRLVISRWTLGS